MPEENDLWLPREDILRFEEIDRLVDQFLARGVDKVRLTGGEPLLRRDLASLVDRLATKTGICDLALTTNAVLLAPLVADLKAAGLHRLTISLDTLQRDRFVKLARFDELPRVIAGFDVAVDVFPGFKIDSVIIRGVNDEELIPLVEFSKARGAEIRFIEYMDVGAPRRGRRRKSCRAGKCSTRSRRTTDRSNRFTRIRRRQRIASGCRTGPWSESFRRPPSPSASPATAAG